MRMFVVVACLAACGPAHVSLPPAPGPDAPASVRAVAYQRLRADEVIDVLEPGKRGMAHDHYELALADGTRVEAAEDLLATVPDDSDTARYAREARAARHQGWAMIALGVAVDIAGLGLAHATDSGPPRTLKAEPMAFAIGGTLVGCALMVRGLFRVFDEDQARRAAFHSYDADLQRELRICSDGLRLITCDSRVDPSP